MFVRFLRRVIFIVSMIYYMFWWFFFFLFPVHYLRCILRRLFLLRRIVLIRIMFNFNCGSNKSLLILNEHTRGEILSRLEFREWIAKFEGLLLFRLGLTEILNRFSVTLFVNSLASLNVWMFVVCYLVSSCYLSVVVSQFNDTNFVSLFVVSAKRYNGFNIIYD